MSRRSGLAIGILSWGAPLTLWRTLASYRRHGLLDHADEVVVYFNEISGLDRRIAREFGVDVIGSTENAGIGPGLAALVERVSSEHLLFLENDWELIENRDVMRARLDRSQALLREGKADVVRLRHRVRYGAPLCTQWLIGREHESLECLLETTYWMDDPAARYPDLMRKERFDDEDWFFVSARNAEFTNNPCLYRTEFLREAIVPRASVDGLKLENALWHWWREQDQLTVCHGPGLFMHCRIDRHRIGSLRWLHTFAVAIGKRYGIRRPLWWNGRPAVSPAIGGPWRSDL